MGIMEDIPGCCVVGEKGDFWADGRVILKRGDRVALAKGFVVLGKGFFVLGTVRAAFENGAGHIDAYGSNLAINPETREAPQPW